MFIVVVSLNVRAKLKKPIVVLFTKKFIEKVITVLSLNGWAKLKKTISVLFAKKFFQKFTKKFIEPRAAPTLYAPSAGARCRNVPINLLIASLKTSFI